MKEFHCGSLVPGCDWHTRHEEEAEIMRRAVEHMREIHGERPRRRAVATATLGVQHLVQRYAGGLGSKPGGDGTGLDGRVGLR